MTPYQVYQYTSAKVTQITLLRAISLLVIIFTLLITHKTTIQAITMMRYDKIINNRSPKCHLQSSTIFDLPRIQSSHNSSPFKNGLPINTLKCSNISVFDHPQLSSAKDPHKYGLSFNSPQSTPIYASNQPYHP